MKKKTGKIKKLAKPKAKKASRVRVSSSQKKSEKQPRKVAEGFGNAEGGAFDTL